MSNEFVTLINRTGDTLSGTYDGRQFTLAPGKSEHPKYRAIKFVEQNPVMGSEDPRTGSIIYKLGIPELNMPCDPLPEEFLNQFRSAVERWDRAKLPGAKPSDVVPGDNGLYSGNWQAGQGLGSNFTGK